MQSNAVERRHSRRSLTIVLPVCLLAIATSTAGFMRAQVSHAAATDQASVAGADFPPFEELTELTVHQDAMLLVAQQIAATGAAWNSLRIDGTAVLPNADGPVPATFVVNGISGAKLTFQQSSGLTAIETLGSFRKSTYADGTSVIDSSTAGPAGLLPSQLLHSTVIAQRLLALKLTGTATIAGAPCDRLSLRYLLTAATPKQGTVPKNVQVDFYLDHLTHLIVRSVSSVVIPGLLQPELLVTDYTGYKAFAGVVSPQKITQTVGGYPLWEVNVSAATILDAATSTTFPR